MPAPATSAAVAALNFQRDTSCTVCDPVSPVDCSHHDASCTASIVFLAVPTSSNGCPRDCFVDCFHDDIRNCFCSQVHHKVSLLVFPVDVLHTVSNLFHRIRHSSFPPRTQCLPDAANVNFFFIAHKPFIHLSVTLLSPHIRTVVPSLLVLIVLSGGPTFLFPWSAFMDSQFLVCVPVNVSHLSTRRPRSLSCPVCLHIFSFFPVQSCVPSHSNADLSRTHLVHQVFCRLNTKGRERKRKRTSREHKRKRTKKEENRQGRETQQAKHNKENTKKENTKRKTQKGKTQRGKHKKEIQVACSSKSVVEPCPAINKISNIEMLRDQRCLGETPRSCLANPKSICVAC